MIWPFPSVLEEGERAGKFPPRCCLALAMAFLLSTVRPVEQEKVSGTCLDQGTRLPALSDGCLVLSSLKRNVLSTLLYLLLFLVSNPFCISLLPLLLQLVYICSPGTSGLLPSALLLLHFTAFPTAYSFCHGFSFLPNMLQLPHPGLW